MSSAPSRGFWFAGILLISVAANASDQPDEQLVGAWRLVSLAAHVVETGQEVTTFGNAPYGYLNYSSDGRMLVLIVKEDRPRVDALGQMTDVNRITLFNSMIAYGGTFKVEGDRITHNVDISWNENWTGTTQERRFRVEGSRLIITQDPQVGPDGRRTTAVLTWERVK